MAVKNMASCVFLLLFLVAILGFNPASSQSWEAFRNKHIDDSVQEGDNNYCTDEILNRGIKGTRGLCKRRNTFIHKREDIIEGLCTDIPERRTIWGNNPYYLTDCFLHHGNSQDRWPKCNYRAYNYRRRIKITCDNGFPVHFGV